MRHAIPRGRALEKEGRVSINALKWKSAYSRTSKEASLAEAKPTGSGQK